MLVITRKSRERVMIDVGGIRIVLTACEIGQGKVKLGFEAPGSVKIAREEIAAEMWAAARVCNSADPGVC